MSKLRHGIHDLTCSAEEGKKLGWIDNVTSCWNQIVHKYISETESVTATTYSHKRKGILQWIQDTLSHRHHIALMRIEGELGSTQLDHEAYCKELIQISKNDAVKGVIVLVNTPGGTSSASETLRYGIECCRKAGKFTMVVMESVAASGGYWLACAADKIWAQPGTLTGSIGVYGGKLDIEDALKRWNIGQSSVGISGASGSSTSLHRHWSVQQRQRWESMLSVAYQYFIKLVAESRKLSLAQVEALAQGQVWTGEEARDLGLVDALGDFWDAKAWAKENISGLKSLETIDYTPENRYSLKWLLSTLHSHIQSMIQWACTSSTKIYARFHPYTR
jgi:protease-4